MSRIKTYLNKLGFLKNEANPKEFLNTKKGTFNFDLKGNRTYLHELDIQLLDEAVMEAQDMDNPTRQKLYSVYNNLKDLHVKSQMRTAIFKVISQPWVIADKDNKPNKELTELFKKKWFNDLNEYVIANEFWGHSLIYFNLDESLKEFKETKLFPRVHVSPEKKSIIPDLSREDKTFSYVDIEQLKELFLEVEDAESLGLLKDIARYSILKRYAISDWARSSEKWGDPHVVLKSASTSQEEDDKKEAFLKNFGNNNYIMTDKEDEVMLLERKANGSHNIFLDLIKLNNDETSKGINGQTATSDEQSFVGSAEVQERILNDYTLSRLRDLMYFHNEKTIPFLINYNNRSTAYKQLEGYRWIPVALIKEDEDKKSDKPKGSKKLEDNDLENVVNPFL